MTLLFVGCLNWGLIGSMNIDLMALIFGEMTVLARLVCLVMGAAGLCAIYACIRSSGNSPLAENMPN